MLDKVRQLLTSCALFTLALAYRQIAPLSKAFIITAGALVIIDAVDIVFSLLGKIIGDDKDE